MSEFILHHYPYSPYSEKIRAMLAYAGVDWLSVVHKEMPPRPFLEPLAGSYGRIPVAQIGADVFCDSNIIAAEIARISNKPELDLANADADVLAFVDKVEGKIFFACVLGGGSSELTKKIRKTMSLWDIARFFVDRIKMGVTATTDNMIKPTEAKKIIMQHLKEMEELLEDDFVFGSKPTIADFAAYHSLWFVRDLGERKFMNDYPKVCAWMDRIKNLGHDNSKVISGAEALSMAKNTKPRNAANSVSTEKQNTVAVGPADYRQQKTSGKLVFEDDTRWVLAREHDKTGLVHVHFPKRNYKIA